MSQSARFLGVILTILTATMAPPAAAQALNPSGERLVRSGTGHPVAPGVYRIEAKNSGLCLGVAGVSLPKAKIREPYLAQIPCLPNTPPESPPHVFRIGEVEIVAEPHGAYRLIPASSSGCATVARGVVIGPPSIDVLSCAGADDQRFQLRVLEISDGDPIVEIHANNGECVAVREDATGVGAELIRWACNGHAGESFRLRFVSPPYADRSVAAQAADWYAARGPAGMISVSETPGVNFYGSDYDSATGLSLNDCKARCADQSQCRAVSFVRERVQGPATVCWLKNAVPPANADANVSSAIVRP